MFARGAWPFCIIALLTVSLLLPAPPQVMSRVASAGAPLDNRFSSESGFSSPAASGWVGPSPFRFEHVGRIGGDVESVAISDTTLYVGEGSSLTIYDLAADPPVQRTRLPLPDLIRRVEIAGDIAYIAAGSQLHTVGISDSSRPVLADTYTAGGTIDELVIRGGLAYVAAAIADTRGELRVLDLRSPAALVLLGRHTLLGRTLDLDVVNGRAYAAQGSSGLAVVDVGDPANISVVATYSPSSFVTAVDVFGNFAYIGGYVDHSSYWLQVVDVRNPGALPSFGRAALLGEPRAIQVQDDLAYVASRGAGLHVIDVSDPRNPEVVGGYGPAAPAHDVRVVANKAYVAGVEQGVQILDVRDPRTPSLVWRGYDPPTYPSDVEVVGNQAYVTAYDYGIQVHDVTDPHNPIPLGGNKQTVYSEAVDVKGTLAYVATTFAGMAIFDVSNPMTPTLLGSADITTYPTDIQAVGNIVYLAAADQEGLKILDAGDPTHPMLLGAYSDSTSAVTVEVVDEYAYIGEIEDRSGDFVGLSIMRVDDPHNPTPVGWQFYRSGVIDVQVVGDLAYVLAWLDGFEILDVSDPRNPIPLGRVPILQRPRALEVVGNLAYVTDEGSGVHIVDVTDARRPVVLGRYDRFGDVSEVVGDLVYLVTCCSVDIVRVRYVGYNLMLPVVRR